MKTLKELGKQALIVVMTILLTMLISGGFTRAEKIKNSASKDDLIKAEQNAKKYTDDVMQIHEKKESVRDQALDTQYQQIQSDLNIIKKYLIEKK